MSHVNDLAIVLTKRIEDTVYRLCADLNQMTVADFKKKVENVPPKTNYAPSFFMLRAEILKTLEQYMDHLMIETKTSPELERHYSNKILTQVKHEEMVKQCMRVVEKIVESPDHFHKMEFKDEWDRFKVITSSIVVIKTEKLLRENQYTKPGAKVL